MVKVRSLFYQELSRRVAYQRVPQAFESFLQISRQILWGFHADVVAEHQAGVRSGDGGAQLGRVGGDDEAFEAAPAGADLEIAVGVNHTGDSGFVACVQHDAEQTARAGEVALPDGVSGFVGKGGIEAAQPLGDLQAGRLPLPQPGGDGVQAAQGRVAGVPCGDVAEGHGGLLDATKQRLGAGGDDADDRVAVAGDVLRSRLDGSYFWTLNNRQVGSGSGGRNWNCGMASPITCSSFGGRDSSVGMACPVVTSHHRSVGRVQFTTE